MGVINFRCINGDFSTAKEEDLVNTWYCPVCGGFVFCEEIR